MTVRVLVADDQPLMRTALVTCLSAETDFEVVGEASTELQRSSWCEACGPTWP